MSNPNLEIIWPVFLTENEAELMISYLNEIGFTAFHEDDGQFKAYIEKANFNEDILKDTLQSIPVENEISNYSIVPMEDINWNQAWESNFSPIVIDGKITVRAPFHQSDGTTEWEIIILPKMSFGTGHHETTAGMLEMMMSIDFTGKTVIDMGSGTGILSVFAEKLGASLITAIDNDPVCTDNCLEIIMLNDCTNITVLTGDAGLLKNTKADIVLANINRNILLNDIQAYKGSLNSGGLLLMSGFYEHDFSLIDEECTKHDLRNVKSMTKNNWTICLYK